MLTLQIYNLPQFLIQSKWHSQMMAFRFLQQENW